MQRRWTRAFLRGYKENPFYDNLHGEGKDYNPARAVLTAVMVLSISASPCAALTNMAS